MYINEEKVLKTVLKYVDENYIIPFLLDIEFTIEDNEDVALILKSNNAALITYCINNITSEGNFTTILDWIEDNIELSDTALEIIRRETLKEKKPDIIYDILQSKLVTWNYQENPFEIGFFDGDCVDDDSILSQDEVNILFSIWAINEGWLKNVNVHHFAADIDSLTDEINKNDYDVSIRGGRDIEDVIEMTDKDFINEYFNNDIPEKVDGYTLAKIMIKYGIYK